MARMIPPEVHPGCQSHGEREIFRRLREEPATAQWVVFHSLDVARHKKRLSGELDFVVVIPGLGVLCVEVKACSRLVRKDGLWFYGAEKQPDPRGPFKQASQGMHSIREYLTSRDPKLASVPFWTAVVFPYVGFSESSSEWHPWQVIDAQVFRSKPLSSAFAAVLRQARSYIASRPGSGWLNGSLAEPTAPQVARITDLLRGDFEYFEPSTSIVKRLEGEVKRYTEEQFAALDAMQANSRVAFVGPAGTGKTLLAIESCRRAVCAGRKVLFLCFNRHLGHWLEEQVKDLGSQVRAGTLHRFLLELAKIAPGAHSSPQFWSEELPGVAIDRLLSEGLGELAFDEVVIDEGQDVLRDVYVDVLDLCLKGGLSGGRWRVFGDFENQAIYGGLPADLSRFCKERGGLAPIFSLRTNCRNTPRIAALTELLGRLSPAYSRVLRPDDGVEPDLVYYADTSDQLKQIAKSIEGLQHDGYGPKDIVLLSARSDERCAAASLNSVLGRWQVKPLTSPEAGKVHYGTIHAFKGMEAPAVILTDIEDLRLTDACPLFYVGITRSIRRLVVVMHQSMRKDIIQTLTRVRGAS